MSTGIHAQSSMFGRFHGVDDVDSSSGWRECKHSTIATSG